MTSSLADSERGSHALADTSCLYRNTNPKRDASGWCADTRSSLLPTLKAPPISLLQPRFDLLIDFRGGRDVEVIGELSRRDPLPSADARMKEREVEEEPEVEPRAGEGDSAEVCPRREDDHCLERQD